MKHRREANGRTSEIDPFSRFIGRLDYQIEVFANHVLGCSTEELAARIGTVYVEDISQPQLSVEEMPAVRGTAAEVGKRLRKVAVGGAARGDGARPRKVGSGKYWDKMTPEERSKEMQRRMLVAAGKLKPKSKKRVNTGAIAAGRNNWWFKLSRKEKDAIIAKRIAGAKRTQEANRAMVQKVGMSA